MQLFILFPIIRFRQHGVAGQTGHTNTHFIYHSLNPLHPAAHLSDNQHLSAVAFYAGREI